MATARERYADTDVSGGAADGSSLANAYATMGALEAGQQTNLVTADVYLVPFAYATAGTADVAHTWAGYTTDATRDIRVTCPQRTTQILWDTSIYRVEATDANTITINQLNISFTGIQVKCSYTTTTGRCFYLAYITAAAALTFTNCYILGNDQHGIYVEDADYSVTVNSCIFVKTGATQSRSGIFGNGGTTVINHCTIYGWYIGIQRSSGTWSANNCVVFNNTDDFNGTITIDHCASDDGDGTNAIAPSGGSWANEFTDYTNGDFTPLPTGNIYQAGADLAVATDYRGTAYHATTPTVGAFEYVSGSTEYNETLAETINLSESLANTNTISIALTDTVNFSESESNTKTISETLSETVNFSESETDTKTVSELISDIINLSESITKTIEITAPISDSITIIESLSSQAEYILVLSDTITISDLLSVITNGVIKLRISVAEKRIYIDAIESSVKIKVEEV